MAYVGLKAYCQIQEETVTMEKERSQRMTQNLEKLSKTYLLLEKRYKTTVVGLQSEKDGLLKTIEELKEQCDHLRLINADCNANDQTYRLQEEVEVLRSQLSMQEDKYQEDIALLKQKHSDELQRYKMLLQNAKKDTSNEPKKRTVSSNPNKNKQNTSFRWPKLNVERINTPMEATSGNKPDGNKKRKLFSEDSEATFDLV
ncbi:uncharacterized protein LOC100883247 isoform X2 [Megachile rotundata]|uniref:uncharacterized protein LOC100883247 isoform X2 n=1 Tax=Megachile rotundata TaxID=143995 RepID=UPI003FD424BA